MNVESRWYAVRTIFRHSVAGDSATFEEKINIYRSASEDQAVERAMRDAKSYLGLNPGFTQVKQIGVYEIGGGAGDLDGCEIWSHLATGPADPGAYYEDRYERFELRYTDAK